MRDKIEITPEQLKQNVSFDITWNIPPELIQLWMAASRNEFIGGLSAALSPKEAHGELIKLRDTKKYGGRERLGFLAIYYNAHLIGFSLPRVLDAGEYLKYGVDNANEYYRMGTIFVREDCRNRGIATEATRQFMQQHPYLVWEHDSKNTASQRVALHLGMSRRHFLYYDMKNSWYMTPLDICKKTTIGWATGVVNATTSDKSKIDLNNIRNWECEEA